ncbi:hypothetical protein LJE86_03385 [bacterium BMS3Abin03]|jgi:hypothetical protein|nr:hypothetical protein [bacterium BMS3Abin03]MCG6959685.1 hypothetical protein [bacterium BMS3Abin03]
MTSVATEKHKAANCHSMKVVIRIKPFRKFIYLASVVANITNERANAASQRMKNI